MKRMCEVSIAGIFLLALFVFVPTNKAGAQAKVSESVRFLSSEEIGAMLDLSTRGALDQGRPDYPVIMRGWRVSFDQPWLSFIFDHPVLWFVEEAAVASLRNYSDSNSRTSVDGKKLVENSAADVSKDFFRRVLLNPLLAAALREQDGDALARGLVNAFLLSVLAPRETIMLA